MADPIAVGEDEGGSAARMAERGMIGTLNQIAVQIKSQVDAEFDRMRKVLEYARRKQSPEDVTDIDAIIRVLEDKRTEVMENEQAGYFINDWYEWRNQVSQRIVGDPRYKATKAGQMARSSWPRSSLHIRPDFH